MPKKPDVDLATGLSPSISISQKSTGNNPRSTVGNEFTEIQTFLRVLYARVRTDTAELRHDDFKPKRPTRSVSRVLGWWRDALLMIPTRMIRTLKRQALTTRHG